MQETTRLLVIGHRDLGMRLAQVLPECDVTLAERPLEGVWQSGREGFASVVVSLSLGERAVRVVQSVRRLGRSARVLLACQPVDEPLARRILREGADEYLLEPIEREDLEGVLGLERVASVDRAAAPMGPSPEELVRFSEVLRQLDAGARSTVQRLAEMLRDVFRSEGVVIELDALRAEVGDATEILLEEPLLREGRAVGRVGLARRSNGSYAAAAAAWLSKYAVLILAAVDSAQRQEELLDLAWSDDVSGLRNRRYFDKRLDELLAQAATRRQRLTVLLFDLDDFKRYNDRFGHETGDGLLREMGMLLKRCTRVNDVVARYAGDEFAVIFNDCESPRVPGSQHPSEPLALAERFCAALEQHRFECLGERAPGPVTISGGLAAFPWDGATREQLMRAADDALLAAKREGKNRIQVAGSAGSA